MTVALSSKAFRRGVNDTLTLKPLREAASRAVQGDARRESTGETKESSGHSVTVVKKNKSWHVRKDS